MNQTHIRELQTLLDQETHVLMQVETQMQAKLDALTRINEYLTRRPRTGKRPCRPPR